MQEWTAVNGSRGSIVCVTPWSVALTAGTPRATALVRVIDDVAALEAVGREPLPPARHVYRSSLPDLGSAVPDRPLRPRPGSALAHEGEPLLAITAQLGHSSTALTDPPSATILCSTVVVQSLIAASAAARFCIARRRALSAASRWFRAMSWRATSFSSRRAALPPLGDIRLGCRSGRGRHHAIAAKCFDLVDVRRIGGAVEPNTLRAECKSPRRIPFSAGPSREIPAHSGSRTYVPRAL